MSLVNKNTLGGGDGIRHTINKKRTPVASSRRFATRGVVNDAALREKLEEALETYSTPPESPFKRRSLTVPEFSPHKKVTEATKRNKSPGVHEWKMVDAGRCVSHQLVLNAWRRRRRQVAALSESRDQLQTQVEQLQMQVDVLQKLRAAEGRRRGEALCECKTLENSVERMRMAEEQLQQKILSMEKNELCLVEKIENLNISLINERNNLKTTSNQKALCEQAYNKEKQQMKLLAEDNKNLMYKIEKGDRELEAEKDENKKLKELVKTTERKYVETHAQFVEAEGKCHKLEQWNVEEKNKNIELENLLTEARIKHEKLESKLREFKKNCSLIKQQRKNLEEENETLRNEIIELHTTQEKLRQLWKSTGKFVGKSFEKISYLLFPALPPQPHDLEVLKYSIN